MGQKVHPIGIRLGVVKKHNANWYANPKQYSEYLINDIQVREYLRKKLDNAMISNIMIERPTGAAKITIATARPGIVIGKKGEDIERLQKELTKIMGVPAQVNIEEITSPDLDARLVADGIGSQLERRVMFRRAMKRAVQNSADIDYASIRAETTYGTIGVKVWIFRGEILDGMNSVYNPVKEEQTRAPKRRGRGNGNRRNTDRG